jgi:hypothetical protein
MKREVGFLNFLCIVVALIFVAFAILNAVLSRGFLTTDNLFVTMVCMVMALMFAINPLFYLWSEGKLPLPFVKRVPQLQTQQTQATRLGSSTPSLLDAKGRPVPPDVSAIVARMGQREAKDI